MLELQPFPPLSKEFQGIRVEAQADIQGATLRLAYRVSGPIDRIHWPEPVNSAEPASLRKDELWMHTCLEAFIQKSGETGYREINLAPSGHWNIYRFDSYRRGMRPDPSSSLITSHQKREAGFLEFEAGLNIEEFLSEAGIQVGLTAVLESVSDNSSYWALKHISDKADFHQAGSFTLRLLPKS